MTGEQKRSRAERARELARHARHLATLMHQPSAKQELLAQASALDHEAAQLENGVRS